MVTKKQVLEDALSLVETDRLTPHRGAFLWSAKSRTTSETLSRGCVACVLGAIFYARFKGKEVPEFEEKSEYLSLLEDLFTPQEMAEMELAFEGSTALLTASYTVWGRRAMAPCRREAVLGWRSTAGARDMSATQLLPLILRNAIANGSFNPEASP